MNLKRFCHLFFLTKNIIQFLNIASNNILFGIYNNNNNNDNNKIINILSNTSDNIEQAKTVYLFIIFPMLQS